MSADFEGALPPYLEKIRLGIESEEPAPELIKAGFAELLAAFPGLNAQKMEQYLDRDEKTIAGWMRSGSGLKLRHVTQLRDLVLDLKRRAILDAPDVCPVREDLVAPEPSIRFEVGLPPVWDSTLYSAFDQLLFSRGIAAKFGFLRDWSEDAFTVLENKGFDVLIHNRFLLTTARKAKAHLDLRMSHPLYVYRGQFVFARRSFVEQCQKQLKEGPVKKELRGFLADLHPYALFGPTLKFPQLSPEARKALLERARPAYMPRTDHELVFMKLYDIAFGPGTWSKRRMDARQSFETEPKLSQETPNNERPTTVSALFGGFRDGDYDLFCGGIPLLWKFAREDNVEPPFLTICDPHELSIQSLNGLIVPKSTLEDRQSELDQLALAFYTGIRFLREWYQSISIPQLGEVPYGPIGAKEHLLHMARVSINETRMQLLESESITDDFLFLPQVESGAEEERSERFVGRDPTELAWAWTRLMMRYVDFFYHPSQVNNTRLRQETQEYAIDIENLDSGDG
jgi:hypothetical protein